MEKRPARVLQLRAASLVGLTALLASAPTRADLCVSCTGPDARYACSVAGVSMSKDDARYKLLCITELAKLGGHQSCAVSRAVTAPCAGEPKTIAAPADGLDVDETLIPTPPAPSAPAQAPTDVAKTTTVAKTPPQPAEQAQNDGKAIAGDTPEKPGEGPAGLSNSASAALEKAGKAVGDAAKTTWKCLSSLFGDC